MKNNLILKKNKSVIYRNLVENKLFLYNEISQEMFCFNEIGNFIWNNINNEITLKEIVTLASKQFEIEDVNEIDNFITFLIDNNLTENTIVNENNSSSDFKTNELWRFIYEHTGKYFPVNIMWEITYKCNQKCIHCCQDCQFTHDLYDLDTETIKKHLIDLKKAGCFILAISGGEPFVRKDIFKILEFARELNFSIVLGSNASIIKQEDILKLKAIGINKICITLFSILPEIHDKIANRNGLHEKTINTIKKIREQNITVRINCPLTIYNFEGYKDIVKFAKEYDCELVVTPTMSPKDDGNTDPILFALSEEQIEIVLKDKDIVAEMDLDKSTEINKLDYPPCNAVFNSLAISANGKVYPCNSFKLECGDINMSSLSEIWKNSKILEELRNTKIASIPICNSCEKVFNCLPCPAYSWLENKQLLGKSTISCKTAGIRYKLGI